MNQIEISGTNLNPFLSPILDELAVYFHKHTVTNEHQIIKHLQNQEVTPFQHFSLHNTNDLFSAHFLCMHALYHLKQQYELENTYRLIIESVRVERIDVSVNDIANHATNISTVDELAAYYLNAKHYFETKEEEINELLTSFWQLYFAQNDKNQALATLQLPVNATKQMIKRKYLQLAQQYHPDKGGCKERFIAIKEAKLILDKCVIA